MCTHHPFPQPTQINKGDIAHTNAATERQLNEFVQTHGLMCWRLVSAAQDHYINESVDEILRILGLLVSPEEAVAMAAETAMQTL